MTQTSRRRAAQAPELVGGRFEIDAELGRGGMAVVYAAIDKQTGGRAAVKLMTGAPDEEGRERFARELRAASELEHPGVCRVLAFGDERGAPWLAMELVDGPTLASLAARAALPPRIAAEVLRQLLEALGVAHKRSFVHRDLKPSNVMLARDGTVKLLDFGIAKATGDTTVTATGALVGTPAFMSPEQARSQPTDARSDLFSLGLTIAALTRKNRHRFTGLALEPTQLLLRVAVEPAAPLCEDVPETPVALDAMLGALCALDPDARFGSASEALAALAATDLVPPDGPALLARFLKEPARVADEERHTLAERELLAARRLERIDGAGPAAALAAARAFALAPTLADAKPLRDKLARAHGFVFPDAPLADARLDALDAELRAAPDNPAVLLRRAHIFAEQHDLRREAAALWRAVRARPDALQLERVRTLLCGPASPQTDALRALIGPRRSGSGVARAVLSTRHMRAPTRGSPSDVVLAPSRGVGETSWLARGVIAAMLLFAAAFTVSMVRGLVDAARPKGIPGEDRIGDAELASIQQTLRGAHAALEGGDPVSAQQLSTEVLTKKVSLESGREALFVRARARQQLGLTGLALKDLDQMEAMATSAADPRAPDIAALRSALKRGPSGTPELK